MVKCQVCSGDASLSGTTCALCKKIIDIQCHGGTIGDGYVICKICAGIKLLMFLLFFFLT